VKKSKNAPTDVTAVTLRQPSFGRPLQRHLRLGPTESVLLNSHVPLFGGILFEDDEQSAIPIWDYGWTFLLECLSIGLLKTQRNFAARERLDAI